MRNTPQGTLIPGHQPMALESPRAGRPDAGLCPREYARDGYDHRFAFGSSVPPDTSWVTLGTGGSRRFSDLRSSTEYAFEARAKVKAV